MFIAKNNDFIVLVADTREELEEKTQFMVITSIEETKQEYQLYNGEYLTIEEIEIKKKNQFENDFFNTSLGWVRRKVSMKTGEIKDFLADVLPMLVIGVPILTYTEDGKQNKVLVTEEFLEECKTQYLKDFYG